MNPEQLLHHCLATEEELGRKRDIKWGARNIDIDILFFNNEMLDSPNLTLPHPGASERRFTLLPMSDLAPDEKHPESGYTMRQLLDNMPDDQSCTRTELHLTL
jgi:2-amino-4-hydroxy-6-hydroxymethyldihydropteridine diphosphokinase